MLTLLPYTMNQAICAILVLNRYSSHIEGTKNLANLAL